MHSEKTSVSCESISNTSKNVFLTASKDVLEMIFSYCDLSDVQVCSTVCKQFFQTIYHEDFWKKRSAMLWNQIVPTEYPFSDLVWVEEVTETITWKRIVKHLSNSQEGKFTHSWVEDKGRLFLNCYMDDHKTIDTSLSIMIDYRFEPMSVWSGEVVVNGSGDGERVWIDGDRNWGLWTNWKMYGPGEKIFSDGVRHVGEFKNDELHGNGFIHD